jgi:hypothetical protein
MITNPKFRIFLVLAILFVATYALAEGIRYGSVAGVIMSILSLVALYVVSYLLRKLAKLREEEEEESIN